MKRSLKELEGYRIQATDGELGRVRDVLFEERSWAIRYIQVDTGHWLPGRQVLISPVSAGEPDWETHHLPVNLTVEQVEQSPSLQSHLPVSRRHEAQLAVYYGWPIYWASAGEPDESGTLSDSMAPVEAVPQEEDAENEQPQLRSTHNIRGYRLRAVDGGIGHVDDVIADTEAWTVRYLVVDTRNWLPSKRVLISTAWVRDLDWAEATLSIDVTCEEVRDGPEYDPRKPVNREYEARYYDYYGRPRYWE